MKQTIISFGTALVIVSLLVGCGKKEEEKIEKHPERLMEEARLDQMTPEEAYVFDDEFADFDEFNRQFAFVDEEDQTNVSEQESANVAFADDSEDGKTVKFQNIKFNFNSDALRKDQLEVLHKDIEGAKEAIENGKNIEVHGYRCPMGEATFNMALAQRSANNIKKVMVDHGVSADKIVALGDGQENLIVEDDNSSCDRNERIKRLAPNRRVEILAV